MLLHHSNRTPRRARAITGALAALLCSGVAVNLAGAGPALADDTTGTTDAASAVLTPDTATTTARLFSDENTSITLNVLANDTVPNGSAVTAVASTDTSRPDEETGNIWTLNADNSVTFTPGLRFAGTTSASYTVTFMDGSTGNSTITVTVPPLLRPQFDTTHAGVSVDIYLTTFSAIPADGVDIINVTATHPADGTWKIDRYSPSVRFYPSKKFAGTTTATYTGSFTDGSTATSTITVTVKPEFSSVAASTPYGKAINIPVLTDSAVPTGSRVSAVTGRTTTAGTWKITSASTVRFTPAQGFYGTAKSLFTVKMPDGSTGKSTISVLVTAPLAAKLITASVYGGVADLSIEHLTTTTGARLKIPYGTTMSVTPRKSKLGKWSGTTSTALQFIWGRKYVGASTFKLTLNYAQGPKVVSAVTVIIGYPLDTAKPKISGTFAVGKKLTATTGTWTSGTKFYYQWYANGTPVKGATKRTLKLTKALKGKSVQVAVTGALAYYVPETRRSAKHRVH